MQLFAFEIPDVYSDACVRTDERTADGPQVTQVLI